MSDAIDIVDDPDEDVESDFSNEDALEKKYEKQMRQIFPQKIELPISQLKTMVEDQIKLSPDFQRRDRWDRKKQSRFVESIIMNVPIPPVFLGEDKYGFYVVLDGRQRLTAIYEFLRNTYALEKLEVWKELNGLSYNDLEDKGLDPTIRRRFIPAVLLLRESSPEVKYDVFDRLNTGGVPLNAMEIRNAVFPGGFNKLLHTLSGLSEFRDLWGIPQDDRARKTDNLYSNMRDLEFVLRFFSLRDPSAIRKSFKWWLGHYLEMRNEEYENDAGLQKVDTDSFMRAIETTTAVFGSKEAFMGPRGKKSVPLADAVMVAFSRIAPSKLTQKIKDDLKSAVHSALKDNIFVPSISTGTNGKGAISTRIETLNAIVEKFAKDSLA